MQKIISPENAKGLFELQKTLQEILVPQPPKAHPPKHNQYDNSAVDVEMTEPVPVPPAANSTETNKAAELNAELPKAAEVNPEAPKAAEVNAEANNINEKADVANVIEKADAQAKETPEKTPTPPEAKPSTSSAFSEIAAELEQISKDSLNELHEKLTTLVAEAQLAKMKAQREKNAAKTAAVEDKNDVEMAKGDDKVDNDSSTDSTESSDAGSEKGDDWTLINKDINGML